VARGLVFRRGGLASTFGDAIRDAVRHTVLQMQEREGIVEGYAINFWREEAYANSVPVLLCVIFSSMGLNLG